MIERLVTKFINFQLELGTMQENDIEVYKYGYIVFLELLLNSCLSLCIGAFIGQLKAVLFFLCVFIPLRSFCGGYHADKAWKCVILSNFVIISSVLAAGWAVFYGIPQVIKLAAMIMAVMIIAVMSPVENENKKLGREEKKKYRLHTIGILTVELAVEVSLMAMGKAEYYNIVLISHIYQVVLIFMAFLKEKNRHRMMQMVH